MATDLTSLRKLGGFVGAALVDSESGMLVAREGGGSIDMEVAAAANTEVIRAKRRAMDELNLEDKIEDILITLGEQYHVIRLLPSNESFFLYAAIDRNNGNLALARVAMKSQAEKMKL